MKIDGLHLNKNLFIITLNVPRGLSE